MERQIQRSKRQPSVYLMANEHAVLATQLLKKQGKCLHMLSGNISYGLCSRGYNCIKCPFEQMMEDTGHLPN
jgi:hypothetical protein